MQPEVIKAPRDAAADRREINTFLYKNVTQNNPRARRDVGKASEICEMAARC